MKKRTLKNLPTLHEATLELVSDSLRLNKYNQSKAARSIGVSRGTLIKYMNMLPASETERGCCEEHPYEV